MLKSPLLSRIFKSKEAKTAPLEDQRSASSSAKSKTAALEEKSTESPPAVKLPSALDTAETETTAGLERALAVSADFSESAEKPGDGLVKAVSEKSGLEKSGLEKSGLEKSVSEKSAEKIADSQAKKFKLPKVTTTQAVIALGVLAAAAGALVPRVMSPTTRASMTTGIADKLAGPVAPVSSAGDPVAQSVVTTGNLLVTNQVLYRKLEAIAGVTIVDPKDRVAPVLPIPSSATAANTTPGNASNPAGDKPTAGKPDATASAGDDKKAESEAEGKQDAKPDPDTNVTAAAPPAPIADPVVFTGTTIDSVLEMRVAVAKDVSGIGFATSGNGVIADLDGNELKVLSPEVGVFAEGGSGGLVVDGETMPSAFWVYPEDGGYVAIGDSWYRGRMLIAQRERGLIAVNYVLLGDYLYSVVGSEMSPGWSIESLKAQAVAARSYALTHNIHPASEDYFDLDNTQRFQAYKGIAREANTTQAAVQATAGEFISHDGGIVESLYAASQAIVDDAHKGAGMSQLGAKDLAEQGYSYQEILVHYYPGTALGRLETDQE